MLGVEFLQIYLKKAYSEDFTFENFNPEIKKETENKITSLIDFSI